MPIDVAWEKKVEDAIKPYGRCRWHEAIIEHAEKYLLQVNNAVILEAGCGRECWISSTLRSKGLIARVIGVDIDPQAASNKDIDEFIPASVCDLPLQPASVDMVFSGFVLEHVENPAGVFSEAFRVLKPGGLFIVWTPNIRNPLMMLSSITSTEFHVRMRRLAWGDAKADNAPTYYRMNTMPMMLEAARQAGFEVQYHERFSAAYSYFRMTKPTFIIACILSKATAIWPLSLMRLVLLGVFKKPSTHH